MTFLDNMNQETDLLYIIIKNDKQVLERFFHSLHKVARMALGFSPQRSMYPMSTASVTRNLKGFDTRQYYYVNTNFIELDKATAPRSKNITASLFVCMQETYETNNNGFMFGLLKQARDDQEMSNEEFADFVKAVDVNMLNHALFSDYYDTMLAFAGTKEGRFLQRNWETIGYQVRYPQAA